MKIKLLTLCIFLIASMQMSEIPAQAVARQNANGSVVKIETTISGPDRNGNREIGNGTGWCYHDALHVVTALHVVAGIPHENISVYNEASTKRSNAKVVKILKEADLALLKLDKEIGLKPLTLDKVDPNSTSDFWIWGYPHGIPTMIGGDIKFMGSIQDEPILNDVLQNEKLKKDLEKQNYPQMKTQILRPNFITPGHSGAPIFNSSGKVIGIGGGGLREGAARLNWAFPASLYVPLLFSSNERPFPTQRSIQASLFSSTIAVQEAISEEEQYKMMEAEISKNTIGTDNLSVTKIWTLSYDEILDTMDEEDQDDLNKIAWKYEINMNSTRYDVYEDFNTGATITIPAGGQMVYENGWFMAANASQNLFYYASVDDAGNFENAIENAESVFGSVMNLQFFGRSFHWFEAAYDPDDFEEDDYWEDASYYRTRYAGDVDDPDYMLIFNAEIDQSESLIVFLVVDLNLLDEDDEYLREYLQYSIALNLADFAGN
jgi:hypothetical protein